MGASIDAYLFFGFDFHIETSPGDEEELYGYNLSDWKSVYRQRLKRQRPNLTEPERDGILEKLGIAIDIHGDLEGVVVWYVFVERAFISANLGSPEKFTELPDYSLKDKYKLKEFCQIMNIEWQEPTWVLASYRG